MRSFPATSVLWVLAASLAVWGCKDPIQETESTVLEVLTFEVDPIGIQFNVEDGIRDTSITMTMELILTPSSRFERGVIVVSEGSETLATIELDSENGEGPYLSDFTYSTSTIQPARLEILATLVSKEGETVTARHTFLISTFATVPPVLISVENPDTVRIPTQGQTPDRFEAKAYHPVTQNLMDGVFLYLSYEANGQTVEIRDNTADFRLRDDGVSDPSSGRDDSTAADSIYTLLFYVNSGNSPQDYLIHWYARDLSGLYSDTLETPLSIVEP